MAWDSFTPLPFLLSGGYPFRRNHHLKAHIVEYFFVSKYFCQQSLYKQHIRFFSLRKSSMQLSRRLFPPLKLAAHPKKFHFSKNTARTSTRQYDEYPGCVTMLHHPPSLFETIGSCSELFVKRTKPATTTTTTTTTMTTELLINYFFKRLAFTMEMRAFSAKMNLCFDVMLTFSKLMRTIHSSMTCLFQCGYCQCFTFKNAIKFKLKYTSHGGIYGAH